MPPEAARLGSLLAALLVLLLAACGPGADPPAEGSAEGPGEPGEQEAAGGEDSAEGRTLVVALGDSITAGSPLWDPSAEIRSRLPAPDPRSQYEYWAERRLGDEVDFRNCGVRGERTDEIRDRLEECAGGADALIVQGGTNDIAQERPVEEAARDLEAMVEQGQDLGLDIAIADVLPWNNGYPDAVPQIRRLNRLIEAIGKRHEVPVLPFHDTLEDPDAPGLMARPWTIDGAHPSIPGYRRLGRLVELPLSRSG